MSGSSSIQNGKLVGAFIENMPETAREMIWQGQNVPVFLMFVCYNIFNKVMINGVS